jgi:hypothetical protein
VIATAERTAARIVRWQLLDGSDRYEQRGWVQIDECELTAIGLLLREDAQVPTANVVLHAWLDHQDPATQVAGLYRAELPDGSRSDAVRWPRSRP